MKRLIVIVVVAALAWAGFWAWQMRGLRAASDDWFAARQADGWVAEYDTRAFHGFPNRLDQRFTGLELADPASGWAWTAPEFHLMRLSYSRDHVIAAWPPEQTISTPMARHVVHSDGLRASLVRAPGSDAIKRANLESATLTVETAAGPLSMADLAVGMTQQDDAPIYRLQLGASGLILPGIKGVEIKTGDVLPTSLETLRLDATVTFTDLLHADRGQDRPTPKALNLALAQISWGELDLQGAGRVQLDDNGLATGKVMVKVKNWQEILRIAQQAGYFDATTARRIKQGLGLLSGLSGHQETLDLPLDLDRGRVKLGPIGLGSLPPLEF